MSDAPPHDLFEKIHRLHGHRCPMSTLGGRMGYAALKRCPEGGPWQAFYYARTCALDGIAVATGCREEDGALTVLEAGRHLLQMLNADGDCGVEVALRREALDIAWEYRRVSEALDRERGQLSPQTLQTRERQAEQVLDDVLGRLRNLPDDALLLVSRWMPEGA